MELKTFENFFGDKDTFNKKVYEQYGHDDDDDDDDDDYQDDGPIEPYVPRVLQPGEEWWN